MPPSSIVARSPARIAVALLIGSFTLVLPSAAAAEVNPLLAAVGAPSGLVLRGSLRARVESIGGQFRPSAPDSDSLRASIISIALWVDRFTSDVVAGRESIEELIVVNRAIIDGLTGDVAA